MRFEAFAKSWRAPQQISGLELWTVPNATSRIQALLTGQVDVLEAIGIDDVVAHHRAAIVLLPPEETAEDGTEPHHRHELDRPMRYALVIRGKAISVHVRHLDEVTVPPTRDASAASACSPNHCFTARARDSLAHHNSITHTPRAVNLLCHRSPSRMSSTVW